jgi:hypothetical protein
VTQDETTVVARRAGFDCRWASVWDDGSRVRIDYGNALTYEMLRALSEAFGTTRIDVGADHGTGSDPSFDPYVIVWLR